MNTLERVVVGLSALVLIAVGSGAAIAPAAFYESYGIDVVGLPALANELRATGVALALLGIATAAAVLARRAEREAAAVAAIVLLGYAIGRSLSWVVDGPASSSLLVAAIAEAVLGAASLVVAIRVARRGRAGR